MIKFKILISISILFLILGCSGGGSSSSTDNGTEAENNTVVDNSTSDVNPPTVSSTSPASGDNNISISNKVTMNFSEDMDPATINTSNITVQDSSGNSVSGVVSYNSKVATFTPSTDLSYFTVYTVTVGIGMRDNAGNAMASNYSWNFTTSSAASSIALTSTAFNENEVIPAVHTCLGTDISPELNWSGNLESTVSFSLILDDPDAQDGFTHWLIYNIPGSTRSLPQNVSTVVNLPDGSIQLVNSFFKTGYSGPCPPERHQYNFTIYALNENLPTSINNKSQLESAMTGKIIAQDTYSGFYP